MKPFQILIVEDNEGDVFLTRETLEASHNDIETTVASDGVAALDYLRKADDPLSGHLPDLILLDLNLPKLDGRGVLEQLKQSELLRRIPVVVLTSSDAETDIIQTYSLGANCYVTKPVGITAFQSVVRSVENFWLSVVRLP